MYAEELYRKIADSVKEWTTEVKSIKDGQR